MSLQKSTVLKSSRKPLVLFFVGMAGSGKTTLVHRISLDLSYLKKTHYILNLDPASRNIPYFANIDIRDTINFKKVMKDYYLGPNGAILTSLNLFSTRFNQVQNIIQSKNYFLDFILIDTPGQIEIFTWSASGSIITESFSRKFPVVLFYIIDIARTINPLTFVSNILYSCSILYKTRLPILLILNKADITSVDFLKEWLNNNDAFDNSLSNEKFFAGSFARSLAFSIDIFHKKIPFLTISALSGIGSLNLIKFLKKICVEFFLYFQEELEISLFRYIKNLNTKINSQKKNENKKINKKFLYKNSGDYLEKCESENFFKIFEHIALLQLENDKVYSLNLK
ncbi:ATP/GTPbp (nucleomorph) [Hemiselmis andersenii]|uniref:GPN-loop GTPase n=1 Tax=Hemiselmis andersenii TaxID=464988 RepID=A9BKW5_HEMAN|nr:ATP/GTPbp [Hemiselmis andersenii]ABW98120.1 ATP/GTPbp [Hemiselmis andersenii]